MMPTRTQIIVRGIVQGVGFRPHVYALAVRRALKGRVLNNSAGVLIDVEGEPAAIEEFINELRETRPPLSVVEALEWRIISSPADFTDFRIVESDRRGARIAHVSPDVATCDDCLRELFDPRDRRYRYPFINCTNCGPRFTITEAVPYDRERTTMRDFEMCGECRREYENPADRRFHAEPVACAACGPRLRLTDSRGRDLAHESPACGDADADVVALARRLLMEGRIVAVKGLGGYHLAADALDAEAVARLRSRKHREEKPFALMARTTAEVAEHCLVSEEERRLLESAPRPVVLLERRKDSPLPEAVAPGLKTLGFMLPYTPLHHLLFESLERPLVMTSGNVSDEPISYADDDARERLNSIADYFLTHDRRINVRADDSVVRLIAGRELVLRRARGYAPAPLITSFRFERQILACGAELKNTFCLARDRHAFVSHHIGDLENLETLRSFTESIEHYERILHLRPEAVAYDLHPEYLSTKYALALERVETKVGVQHHHAHVASCMADNEIEGEVIGVAMDGLGFGADGRMWGGEFFVADFADAERVAHLDYVPMPGGAKAVREPWRMAAVYLERACGESFIDLEIPFARTLDRRNWAALRSMIESGVNCPETSSVGRLFDAVAAILSLRSTVAYEGQAAIELEAAADDDEHEEGYEFAFDERTGIVKAEKVIEKVVGDLLDGAPPGAISAKFHAGLAGLIATVARRAREEHRLERVVLSGGVFQNMYLLGRARQRLEDLGFRVFTHRRVPPNDGGISLGQAAVARARLIAGRVS